MEVDEKYIDKNRIFRLKELETNIENKAGYRYIKLENLNPLIFTTDNLPKEENFVVIDFDNEVNPLCIDNMTEKFITDLREYFKQQRIFHIKAIIISDDYIDKKYQEIKLPAEMGSTGRIRRDHFDQEYLKKNPDNKEKAFRKYFTCILAKKALIKRDNYIAENIYKRYYPEIERKKTKSLLAERVLPGLIQYRDYHPEITDYFKEFNTLHSEEVRNKKKGKPRLKMQDYKFCSRTQLINFLKRIMKAYNSRYPNNKAINVSDLFRKLPSYWMYLTEIIENKE